MSFPVGSRGVRQRRLASKLENLEILEELEDLENLGELEVLGCISLPVVFISLAINRQMK